jgi:catechol-2,3-dioxygenase
MSPEPRMPLVQARRLAYAVLATPALDAQIAYYRDVLGLSVTTADADGAVLASSQGIETVVLRRGAVPGLLGLGFQIDPSTNLSDLQALLASDGIAASRRPGSTPGVAEVVALRDPKGTEIELFTGFDFIPVADVTRGIDPLKLGHVAYFVTEVEELTRFYERALGFRRSDWRGDGSMFLRCGVDHHTINFFLRPNAELAHIAFELKDWSELARASDYLARCGLTLDWGPARHHIGHNLACYHRNPDRIRIELYAEMDQMKDEALGFFEPRPWHEDQPQRPKEWPLTTRRNQWIPDAP